MMTVDHQGGHSTDSSCTSDLHVATTHQLQTTTRSYIQSFDLFATVASSTKSLKKKLVYIYESNSSRRWKTHTA